MTPVAAHPASVVLPAAFYARPTLEVLDDIIGKVLVRDDGRTRTSGIIVEAEAYVGEDDPACHAACGPTARNAPLYGPPGRAYVYLNYGVHDLLNAVTEPAGRPAAVLLRAVAPLEGVEIMRARRRRTLVRRGHASSGRLDDHLLGRGPGNLTIALGVGRRLNGHDLAARPLTIEDRGIVPGALVRSPRIGIRVGTSVHWRCHWKGHLAVSGSNSRR
ncbi:MAG: DNA-3-methyladenine glycosylase [Acidobacteria bacterium]|nr:DNA-3-methyladenine glycosylase [Acidobacteriota bacterium]